MACICVKKCCGTASDSNSRQETAIALAVNPLAEVKDFIQRHGDGQTAPEWLQQVDAEAAETSFQNVTIAIQAATPREAYEKLCAALASIDAEWTTCQGRSKTRPVWRTKSRPVVGSQVVEYSGEEGRWSVAEAALLPRGASGRGRVQRSEDEVRSRRLCLSR